MNHLCLRELAEIIGGRLRLGCMPPLGGELEPLGRIATDSERVRQGDVFWGLATSEENGSWRAEEAYARGALGAVVSGRRLEPWAGKFSLEVEDARSALWRLARAMRRRFTGTLVAVAGCGLERAASELIQAVLGGSASRSRLPGGTKPGSASRAYFDRPANAADACDQDNEGALALRLVELGERERTGVVELRTGERGEVERLANLCCPHIGVLVGSGAATTVAQSKAELLAALPESGIAIVDGDDPGLRRAVGQTAAQVVWFGSGPHCDVYGSDVEWRGGGLSLVVDGQPMHLPDCGRGEISAVLAAYAVGRVLEISPRRIAAAFGRYRPERETIHEPNEELAFMS
jgi:UDP-N-acetylmuramoyl-tripeptide--D-alanyl-D-alanine ligase